jgi:hypothetical protein
LTYVHVNGQNSFMSREQGTIGVNTELILLIVKRNGKALAGHPAEIQGAALADCLAIWLAGHQSRG